MSNDKGEAEMKLVKQPKNKILQQIVFGIIVDASPTKNKDDWKKVFKYASPDFERYELVGGESSKKIKVDVYKTIKDGNFKEICYSLSHNRDGLAVSIDQMSGFCLRNKPVLNKINYSTFFLLKNKREEFFVAGVYVRLDGLHVYVNRFEYGYRWYAGHAHRLVTQQVLSL